MDINKVLKGSEYDFLRINENLGDNIILLGFGGSYAYGTNNENSDIDIRGIATRTKRSILTGHDFEQVVDTDTDTTIYSFDKIIKLLCSSNPNTIEMLGLESWQYIYLTDAGKKLIENRQLFLSKKAIHSFGGYANAQLRRLENKSARLLSQTQQEEHILKSIEHAYIDFKTKYFTYPKDAIKLFIDQSFRDNYDSEIFMNVNLTHYPLRDFKDMWSEMNAIVKSYNKIGVRNNKAITHDKLGKHMTHLVRLYLMCFDILEHGEIITYREKDHDFLMSIRNGAYLDKNRQPTAEFYNIIDKYEKKLDYLKDHTSLPDDVDMKKVNDLVAEINGMVVSK